VLAALSLFSIPSSAATSNPTDLWAGAPRPNNGVNALAASASTVYLGGSFTGFSPFTGPLVAFRRPDGTRESSYPAVVGREVRAITSDGRRGGWFVGGDFGSAGGVACANLVHIKRDRSVDRAWCPAPDGTVFALVRVGRRLYVGGDFETIGGRVRPAIAALRTDDGAASRWNAHARSTVDVECGCNSREVSALAVRGASLYVGGFFSAIGGRPRDWLAALDVATAKARAWRPRLRPRSYRENARVDAIAVSASTVYVAGRFSTVNRQLRANVAAIDATSGALKPWHPNANDEVDTIVLAGSRVYLGGVFTRIGGRARPSLAAVDRVRGRAFAWNPAIRGGGVESLALAGSLVYAVGDFAAAAGEGRTGLAAIDTRTGKPDALETLHRVAALQHRIRGRSLQDPDHDRRRVLQRRTDDAASRAGGGRCGNGAAWTLAD
jgi:hypothetical protein